MKLYLKERHRLISVGGGEGDGGREGVGSEGGGSFIVSSRIFNLY